MSPESPAQFSRRSALKWLAGSSALGAAAPAIAAPNETEPAPPSWSKRHPIYDPDFTKPVYPFEKILSQEELTTISVLADIILPKDDLGPAASEVGVPEFINEWVSAPYPTQKEDRETLRGGIAWLNTESFRRFQTRFDEASAAQQIEIVDDICGVTPVKPQLQVGGQFFRLFRRLVLGGYYTHSSTWQQLGYVGNVAIAGAYPGPPLEVMKLVGVEDEA